MPEMTTVVGTESNDGDVVFQRGPSDIIFRWDEDDGVQGVSYSTGDADIEQEAGMLDDYCKEAVAPAPTGWYVIEGFTTDYVRDYYGEVDTYVDHKEKRAATWRDFKRLWGFAPWWADVLLALNVNLKMHAGYPAP